MHIFQLIASLKNNDSTQSSKNEKFLFDKINDCVPPLSSEKYFKRY